MKGNWIERVIFGMAWGVFPVLVLLSLGVEVWSAAVVGVVGFVGGGGVVGVRMSEPQIDAD